MKANEQSFIVRIDKKAQTENRTVATRLEMGFLGFAHKAEYKKSHHGGVIIHGVQPGGPMALAEFSVGDEILSLDDQKFSDYEKLIEYARAKQPGTQVKVTYISKLVSERHNDLGSLTSIKYVTLAAKAILLPFKDANPMEYNLQYGIITSIGTQAAAAFPQANIGDVLLFSHIVEHKGRDDGDALYNDYHLIMTEESGDELRKVNVEFETYGVLKPYEQDYSKMIIPHPRFVFCHLQTQESELQMRNGIYIHKEYKETHTQMVLKLHKLQSEVREKSTTSVLSHETNESNYRQKEDLIKQIKEIQAERTKISKKMNKKELVDATVLYFNPKTADVLGAELHHGDRLVSDLYALYPLKVLGQHYMLANVLAIEGVHREYTIIPNIKTDTMSKKSYPIPGKVLIKPDPKMIETEGGLLIPDTAQKYGDIGTVYSVYKPKWYERIINALRKKRDRQYVFLEEGMRVKFAGFGGRLLHVPERGRKEPVEVMLLSQDDIDAILDAKLAPAPKEPEEKKERFSLKFWKEGSTTAPVQAKEAELQVTE